MRLYMKMNFKLIFALLVALQVADAAIAQADLVACGDDKVVMIDSRRSTPSKAYITWTWKVEEAGELPEAYRKIMVPLDECKPVLGGKQLLITSSGGGGGSVTSKISTTSSGSLSRIGGDRLTSAKTSPTCSSATKVNVAARSRLLSCGWYILL